MMKRFLIILSMVLVKGMISAQPADYSALMQQANQDYADSKYEAAIETYEQILAANYESSALYFNLGNAYFKKGDIPSAILYYEKSLKLDPTDMDAKFNLQLANSRIIDKIEPLPEFFLKTWWRKARDSFSSDQWGHAGLAAFILVLLSALFFFLVPSVLARKISFWTGIILVVFMLLSISFSIGGYQNYHLNNSGIIFTPTVTVKSSPNDNSVDLFVIHEGTKVFLIDQVEGWSEIKLSNGNEGWVKTTVYRSI